MIRVVKLGGSLLEASVLPACLDAVERLNGQVLVVPGGGMFAEQIRIAQRRWSFDDIAAHRMAILAMQQMALLFQSLKPDFGGFSDVKVIVGLPRIAVWSPQPDKLDAAGVQASWDITSDSLAAWLAAEVGADELLLVKSAEIGRDTRPHLLKAQGIVDVAFPVYAERLRCPISVINIDRFLAVA